jgi:hypothetical protein
MPRSASDATRFTSTTPHAAKPLYPQNLGAARAGQPNRVRTPGPVGETPLERVARLREAAARARAHKLTTFDKVVIRGRVWADRAHRFTALTLIGITGTIPSPPARYAELVLMMSRNHGGGHCVCVGGYDAL